MKQLRPFSAWVMLACGPLLIPFDCLAKAERPPVSVAAYAQHLGGKIVYHYRVTNNTQRSITAVTIGRDNRHDENPDNDVNELLERPSGWNPRLGIPSNSANSPTGWRASVVATDETEAHAIMWEILNERSAKLVPGQTMNKMSVTLEKTDSHYLTGHALITFADGYPESIAVPIEPLDKTPPTITVNLRPSMLSLQNNKFVAVHASFIVKDDYDHTPEVRLVSITANEPLEQDDIRDAGIGLDDRYLKFRATSKNPNGRIYTVTYSATDASGNQATAAATVTVTAAIQGEKKTP